MVYVLIGNGNSQMWNDCIVIGFWVKSNGI